MNTTIKAWLACLMLIVLAPVFTVDAQDPAPPLCFSDWSAAASIVKQEKLVTVEALSRKFNRQKLGEIVKTDLCREPAGYVYRLVIRSANGRFRSARYDAHRGIELGKAQ